MLYVGIDPSFTGTGLALWNGDKTIRTFHLSAECGQKRFVDIARAADDIYMQVSRLLMTDLDGIFVISENPPPQGMFASGLYGLDVYLLNSLWVSNRGVVSIDVVNPNYLQHLHQKRKYAKSESVKLALAICNLLGFQIIPQKRLSADESEAVLFLLRLIIRENPKIVKNVTDLIRPFMDKKEVNLYGGENGGV